MAFTESSSASTLANEAEVLGGFRAAPPPAVSILLEMEILMADLSSADRRLQTLRRS